MMLTETIQLNSSEQLSKLCHLSKNLYNLANWYIRQDLFNLGNYLNYYDIYFMLKDKQAFKELSFATSQQILMLVDRNWRAFFRANKEWKRNPKKLSRRPNPPGYKNKNGENIVIFTNKQCKIKDGYLHFPKKSNIQPIKCRNKNRLHQVRIIPLGIKYKIEIVYEKEEQDLGLNINNILSIDLGLNNIVTAVNNIGLRPIVVKGGVIKSINQYYNKKVAYYKSIEMKKGNKQDTKRMKRLHLKRNNKINTVFHRITRQIINYCIENNIGTIVTGHNKEWKQNINLGKRNNQNFVQIPFYTLIRQLEYKSKLVGIELIKQEESYTSKCSFLDNEPIRKHSNYKGRRISRGLFKTTEGQIINADVNAGYNIMKKAFPNAFLADGIEALGLVPQVISNNLYDIITCNQSIPTLSR